MLTMKHVICNRYPIGNKRFIWKQKDYVLSTFSGVPQSNCEEGDTAEVADKFVKALKECGFNLLELGWVGHDGAWAAVDACEKNEVDLIFQDMSIMGGMQHHHLDNKVPYEVVQSVVDRLKDKKHTIGYYVWDEPHSEEQLTEARRQMDMLQKADPQALLFTVALPNYNNAGKDKKGYTWENGLYAPYIEKFAKRMDPPVLSFDYYPVGDYFHVWPGHTYNYDNQLDDTFMWLDMAINRKVAKENNLPFWFYYQGYRLYKCTDYFIFPMIRCFMYGAILYGAKGLQHYAAGEKGNQLMNMDGSKGEFFEDQKQIHSEIKNLGNTLMALDSKLVYHSGDLLPDCEYIKPLINTIADSEIFTGTLPRRTSVGELEDKYGNRYAVILNRDYEKELSTTLEMQDEFRVYKVSREDGKQRVIHDSTSILPVNLKPGDAVVLRIQKASEEAFTVEYKLED